MSYCFYTRTIIAVRVLSYRRNHHGTTVSHDELPKRLASTSPVEHAQADRHANAKRDVPSLVDHRLPMHLGRRMGAGHSPQYGTPGTGTHVLVSTQINFPRCLVASAGGVKVGCLPTLRLRLSHYSTCWHFERATTPTSVNRVDCLELWYGLWKLGYSVVLGLQRGSFGD